MGGKIKHKISSTGDECRVNLTVINLWKSMCCVTWTRKERFLWLWLKISVFWNVISCNLKIIVTFCPEVEGSRFLQNVGNFSDYPLSPPQKAVIFINKWRIHEWHRLWTTSIMRSQFFSVSWIRHVFVFFPWWHCLSKLRLTYQIYR